MNSIVIVGLHPHGLSIIRRLATHGRPLISIGSASDISACRDELDALGVHSIIASPTSASSILDEVIESATVIILTGDQDAANIDLALRIRRLDKDLPLVVRIFDHALSDYLHSILISFPIRALFRVPSPGSLQPSVGGHLLVSGEALLEPASIEQRTGRVDRSAARPGVPSIHIYLPLVTVTRNEKMFRVVNDRQLGSSAVLGKKHRLDKATRRSCWSGSCSRTKRRDSSRSIYLALRRHE